MDKASDDLDKAIHHLLWVWLQYGENMGGGKYDPAKGNVMLCHMNMNAGEQASYFLKKLGYGEEKGYHFVVNQRGCDLMMREDLGE